MANEPSRPGDACSSAPGQVGAILEGQYHLEEPLRGFPSGTAWRATDLLALDGQSESVLVKFYPPCASPDAFGRAREWVERLRLIDCAEVVGIRHLGRHGGCCYLVTESVAGERLDDWLMRHPGGVSTARAEPILQGIAGALIECANRGLVIQSLSPANICYEEQGGRVTLFNFDLPAFVIDQCGPYPQYASPESLAGAAPSPRDDVYSLGCIAYALLSGRLPFDGITPQSARREGQIAFPLQNLSGRQNRILLRSLAAARAQRSDSPRHLLALLERPGSSARRLNLGGEKSAARARPRRLRWTDAYEAAPRELPEALRAALLLQPVTSRPPSEAGSANHRPQSGGDEPIVPTSVKLRSTLPLALQQMRRAAIPIGLTMAGLVVGLTLTNAVQKLTYQLLQSQRMTATQPEARQRHSEGARSHTRRNLDEGGPPPVADVQQPAENSSRSAQPRRRTLGDGEKAQSEIVAQAGELKPGVGETAPTEPRLSDPHWEQVPLPPPVPGVGRAGDRAPLLDRKLSAPPDKGALPSAEVASPPKPAVPEPATPFAPSKDSVPSEAALPPKSPAVVPLTSPAPRKDSVPSEAALPPKSPAVVPLTSPVPRKDSAPSEAALPPKSAATAPATPPVPVARNESSSRAGAPSPSANVALRVGAAGASSKSSPRHKSASASGKSSSRATMVAHLAPPASLPSPAAASSKPSSRTTTRASHKTSAEAAANLDALIAERRRADSTPAKGDGAGVVVAGQVDLEAAARATAARAAEAAAFKDAVDNKPIVSFVSANARQTQSTPVPPPPPPVVEIPRADASSPPISQGYWYYCRRPVGYYPYVRQCRGHWEKVTPHSVISG